MGRVPDLDRGQDQVQRRAGGRCGAQRIGVIAVHRQREMRSVLLDRAQRKDRRASAGRDRLGDLGAGQVLDPRRAVCSGRITSALLQPWSRAWSANSLCPPALYILSTSALNELSTAARRIVPLARKLTRARASARGAIRKSLS